MYSGKKSIAMKIVYGALEVTNLLKNKGLHALFAFVIIAQVMFMGVIKSIRPTLF